MVLAAGRGERLLPLSRAVPKPAIPVLGRPIVGFALKRLADAGFERVAMNVHHMPRALESLAEDPAAYGLQEIKVFREEDRILGTGGGIRNAVDWLRGEGPVLVHNADFLSDIDLAAAVEAHRRGGWRATLVLMPQRPGYTAVHLGSDGAVLSFGDPPANGSTPSLGPMTFTGCHVVDIDVLDALPAGRPSDIVRDAYVGLAARRQLGGVVHLGLWWEFGTPRDYLEGTLALIDRSQEERWRLGDGDPVIDVRGARIALGPGVDLHAGGIDLRGRVALGLASRIGEAVSLHDTVVMPEAWIGPGAVLSRAIVAMGTEIPAGFSVHDALVCSDDGVETPAAGIDRRDGLLVRPF